jgi:hypothetical protein
MRERTKIRCINKSTRRGHSTKIAKKVKKKILEKKINKLCENKNIKFRKKEN